jgi:signal transduction histidine kinase
VSAPPSIGSRLAWTIGVLSVVWALAVAAAVWWAVRHEVDELLDETLQASAGALLPLLSSGATMTAALPASGEFAWQLVGPGAQVLRRSLRAPAEAWSAQPQPGFSDSADDWRIYGMATGAAGQVLYVAQTGTERREARLEVALSAIVVALAVGAVFAWALRRRVRRELRPLAELSRAVGAHDPLRRGAALPPARRAELAPLHDAIDSFGRGLARRVAHERAFAAHAAHALRTPLAGIDAQLAVALREAPASLRPRLQHARDAAGNLQRVVAALLALFRSGAEIERRPIALAGLLPPITPAGVQVELTGDASVHADPDLLTAALINLLDNALRHGARKVRLDVAAAPPAITLQDDGPGIDGGRHRVLAAALAAQAYEGATGLGLMLADLVARAHGGVLELGAPGPGFRVVLRLGAQTVMPPETSNTAPFT